ncbi:hypothetical protein, partial [Cronobacter dublinensis]|uniref:hypothetical protein n=1 Tax=Cronobacter dublinensis TaxID=413497 RepID=UPI001F340773
MQQTHRFHSELLKERHSASAGLRFGNDPNTLSVTCKRLSSKFTRITLTMNEQFTACLSIKLYTTAS